MADARIPLNAARYNSIGEQIERSNTRGKRRRKGTVSMEFAEGGVHSEVLLEGGGPESNETIARRYARTRRHLGKFSTPRAASAAAEQLDAPPREGFYRK